MRSSVTRSAHDELEDLQRRAVTVAATTLTLSSRAAPHANVDAQRLTGPIGTVESVAQPARVARAALAESTVTRRPKTTHRPRTNYVPPSRNPTLLVGRANRDAYMPNAAMAARLARYAGTYANFGRQLSGGGRRGIRSAADRPQPFRPSALAPPRSRSAARRPARGAARGGAWSIR